MTKVYHSKLIRDNAPTKMRAAGVAFETRQLGRREFRRELLRKTIEEATELSEARRKNDIVGELADMLDLIDEIQKVFGINKVQLAKKRAKNADEKGPFDQRLLLIWSAKQPRSPGRK